MRDTGYEFTDIPLYINGSNSTPRQYQIIEECEYPRDTTVGKFSCDSVTTAQNGGTATVTNKITLKKITLTKMWDDQVNLCDTRPSDITFTVSNTNGKTDYTLTKDNNRFDTYTWKKEIWIPAGSNIFLSENMESQSNATKIKLKDYQNTEIDNQKYTITNKLSTDYSVRSSVTVTKNWADDSTKTNGIDFTSLIRPSSIKYTLYYKYGENEEWKIADSSCHVDKNNATKIADNSNNWTASWTDLYRYFNDNSSDTALPITYKVVEVVGNDNESIAGYTITYSPESVNATTTNAAEIQVTNTVNNTQTVKLQKKWASEDVLKDALNKTSVSTLTKSDIELLQAKGILPESITFQLQYSLNGTDWISLTDANATKTYSTPAEFADLYNSSQEIYNQLPEKNNKGESFKYRLVETKIAFLNGVNSTTERIVNGTNSNWLYTISNPNSYSQTESIHETIITNTVPTKTLTVTKQADDEENRDGKRKDILITLYRIVNDKENEYATATLTYDSKTKEWSSKTWELPIYASDIPTIKGFEKNEWTIVETSADGYSPSYVYKINSNTSNDKIILDNDNNGEVQITNTRTPKRFTASAKKTWDDTDAFSSQTRPENVSLKLEYSLDNGTTWNDVLPATNITDTISDFPSKKHDSDNIIYYNERYYKWDDKDNKYVIDFEGVYTTSSVVQNVKGTSTTLSDTATWNTLNVYSNGNKIKYRVSEVAVPTGYTVSYINQTFEATDNTSSVSVTVKNTLTEKTKLVLTKNWSNDNLNNYTKEMRPNKVEYLIQYSTDGTNWNAIPKEVLGGTVDGIYLQDACQISEITQSATLCGEGTKLIPLLPIYNAQNAQYKYRVKETKLYYGTDSVDASMNAWTYSNTDQSSSITGTIGAYSSAITSIWNSTNKVWTIVATNTLETVSLTASKQWEDAGNRELARTDVTFSAKQMLNGALIKTLDEKKTIQKGTSNNVTWNNLPKYQKLATAHTPTSANRYIYEVVEDTNIEGYTVSYQQSDISKSDSIAKVINTRDMDVFSITGTKVWDDSIDGKTMLHTYNRPSSVELTLQYRLSAETAEWQQITKAKIVNASNFPTERLDSDIIYFNETVDSTSLNGVYHWNSEQSKYVKISGNTPENVNPFIVSGPYVPKSKYNDAEYIQFTKMVAEANGYYKWETDKYVPISMGIYTTSNINQTISTSDTSAIDTWENLPVYYIDESGNKQTVTYRIVETASTKEANPYIASITSSEITGEKDTLKSGTVKNMFNEIKIIKKDFSGKPISGVEFKIEKLTGYDKTTGNFKSAEPLNESTATNSAGEIIFAGLEVGDYRITEVKTTQGYNLLCAPFIVSIPLSMTPSEKAEYDTNQSYVDMTNAVQKDDRSGWEFYQLTYTVTNTADFIMPMTGKKGIWYPGFFAFIPIGASTYFMYRRKKKYNRA